VARGYLKGRYGTLPTLDAKVFELLLAKTSAESHRN
jgi:hypothetical protein